MSEKQRKFLWAKKPKLAREWSNKETKAQQVLLQYPVSIFSEKEVNELFNAHNPNDTPRVIRSKNPKKLNMYSFDPIFYTAWDGNRLIGYSGWKEYDGFSVLGGARVALEYRRGGKKGQKDIGGRLTTMKFNKIKHEPIIGGFNSALGNKWKASFVRRGWKMDPEGDIPDIPTQVVDYHRKHFGKEWGAWHPDWRNAMNKAWDILKTITEEESMLFEDE